MRRFFIKIYFKGIIWRLIFSGGLGEVVESKLFKAAFLSCFFAVLEGFFAKVVCQGQ